MTFKNLTYDTIREILSFLEHNYIILRNIYLLSHKYEQIIKEIFTLKWFTCNNMTGDDIHNKLAILNFEKINKYREKVHILYDFSGKDKHYFYEIIEYIYPEGRSHTQKIQEYIKSFKITDSEVKPLFYTIKN